MSGSTLSQASPPTPVASFGSARLAIRPPFGTKDEREGRFCDRAGDYSRESPGRVRRSADQDGLRS